MARYASLFLATVVVLVSFLNEARSQDTTATNVWQRTLVGQATGAQAGFSNWAEGGVSTVALTLGVDGTAERGGDSWTQKHDLRFSFGLVRQDTLDFRKAEDLIRVRSAFQFAGGEGILAVFQPTLAASARSQFAPGQNFDEDPTQAGRALPVKVSDFFSPATFTQTIGLTYTHSWFSQRLGIAAKETVVSIERLRPLYNISVDKSVRAELGIEAFSEIDRVLAKNVHYKSTLGLFAAFNKPDAPDLIWENLIAMKVNTWLNVSIEWTLIYDTDVASELQAKEVFSIGISYIFV